MSDNKRFSAMADKIELAREPDFSLGSLRISPSTRQLITEHGTELVEPRVMQVLICLTRANAAVVSRDQLITTCWNGQVVGDDAINRCISRLRKYAAGHEPPPFTIETIPRVGYKLTANNTSTSPHNYLESDIARFGRAWIFEHLRHVRRVNKFILSALTIILFLATATWTLRSAKRWTVMESRPLLTTNQLEEEPAISPDGSMIAYVAGTNALARRIYIRRLSRAQRTAISPKDYYAGSPNWSNDDKRIAYATFRSGERCHIYIAHLGEETIDEVGHCTNRQHTSLSWDRASGLIYYVDRRYPDGPDTILSLDPSTHAVKPVTNPRHDIPGDLEPAIAQSGKYLAYIRRLGSTNDEVRITNLSTGRERILGVIRGLKSIAWTWDSETVLASVSDGVGSEIWALPLSGDQRYQIYASSQLINRLASGPRGLLAAEIEVSRKGLALGSQVPERVVHTLDPSNGSTYSPTYSKNGTLAFISNRAGSNAIWAATPHSVPKQIFDGGMALLDRLIWSPNGEQLAFVSMEKEVASINVISKTGKTIFVGRTRSIGYGMPTWTSDGRALIVADRPVTDAQERLTRISLFHITVAPPGWQSVTSFQRKVYAVRSGERGIWRIDSGVRQITPNYPRNRISQLIFFRDSVLIPEFESVIPGILAQPLSGGIPTHFSYTPGASSDTGFAVDTRSGDIVYVTDILENANIDLMHLQLRRW